MEWLNILIQGSLLGGIYALFAIGLSMSFGIMRLVNIAHGDFIVLSAYVALVVTQGTGLDPISSLIIVVPVMFVVGYAIQRGLLNHTLSGGLLPPLLVTFGISVIIQNGLLQVFGAYTQRLHEGAIETASVKFPAASRSASIRWWCSLWRCSPSPASSFCSTAPVSVAPSAQCPMMPTPRSSWASTTASSTRWRSASP